MAPVLEPLQGANYWQVLAVGITGLASLLLTTMLLSFVIWQHIRYYAPLCAGKTSRKMSATVSSKESSLSQSNLKPKALQNIHTQFGILFINLIISDFIQALAFCLNWRWVVLRQAPALKTRQTVCVLQGVLINIGDVACGFWSLAIACHTLNFLVIRRKPPNWVIYGTIAFVWTLNVVFVIAGPVWAHEHRGDAFFTWTRVWCFINNDFDVYRLWLHYLWILICLAAVFIIYLTIHVYLVAHDRQTSGALGISPNSVTAKVARRMLLYPLAYACIVIPITVIRLCAMSGYRPAATVQTVGGVCLSLSGFVDVILYETTRKVVFRDRKPDSFATSRVSKRAGKHSQVMVTKDTVTHYDVSLQDMCPRLSDAEKQRGWGLPPKLGDADTVGPYEDVEAGSSTSTGQPRIPTFTRLNIDQQVALDRATHDPRVSLNFEMSDGHVPGPQGSSGHYLGSQR